MIKALHYYCLATTCQYNLMYGSAILLSLEYSDFLRKCCLGILDFAVVLFISSPQSVEI